MKIDIQTRGFTLTDALRTQTERRLRFAFGGLGARVGRVGVRLTDENGPRGGVDKRCALRISVPGRSTPLPNGPGARSLGRWGASRPCGVIPRGRTSVSKTGRQFPE